MKISKLISIFEKCIPAYQKCVDEKWEWYTIESRNLDLGICCFCDLELNINVYDVFQNHYSDFLNENFGLYFYYSDTHSIENSILPRLEFLKQQVKELKKLQKQGYTHV